jgi:hypothetical protein
MRVSVLALAACAVSGLAALPNAQAQSLARILACSDIPRAEERLQCYDSASRSAIGLGAQPAARPAQPPSEDKAAQDRIRALEARIRELEAGKGAAQASAQSGAGAAEREQALAAREAALAEREAKLSASAQNTMSAEEEATLFGIPIPFTKKDRFNQIEELPNQKVERDEDGVVESIVVNIKEFSYGADERLILVLENGQVWRQIEGDRINLKSDPEKPHVARISRGAVGSFNLNVNEINRFVKVRRVDGVKRRAR